MLEIIILAVGMVASAITGIFVFSRNPWQTTNQIYGLLALALTIWPIFNHLSLQTDDRLFYIRMVMFLVSIVGGSLFYLIIFLEKHKKKLNKLEWAGIGFVAFVALSSFTPFLFLGLTDGPNPTPVPNVGALVYLIFLLVFFGGSLALLLRRAVKLDGIERLQSIYMLVGATPMFLLGAFTGFIMPVVMQNASLVWLTPVYATLFVILVGYSIVKHRLFDIRLVVARAVAYGILIVIIGLVYGFIVFGVVDHLFPDTEVNIIQQLIYVVTAIFLAFSFQPLKQVLDKFTDRIFYRDHYQTEDVLGYLSKTLVAKGNDFDDLLHDSLQIIINALKTENGHIVVFDNDKVHKTVSKGSSAKGLTREALYKFKKKLSIYDEIEYGDEKRSVLNSIDSQVVLRIELKDVLLGYLVLGQKQNGTTFTQQDANLLNIASQELAVAIQNSLRFEEIQNFNKTLQKEVETKTRSLQRANTRLRQLDEIKDEFITMASHQLRTPLTSVKGYASMLLDGDGGKLNQVQGRILKEVFLSSERMSRLINDFLNISRLRTGKFVIEQSTVDMAQLVEREVSQLQGTAKVRGVKLNFDKPENIPPIEVDEEKIQQVVMNILDNAIYYSKVGKKIDVQLMTRRGELVFKAKDQGIGVPKVDKPHLFTKFYRGSNARKQRPDGTGIGLFMAQKVVTAHNGSMIFESTEGKGSTFGFTLPLPVKNEPQKS